MPCSLVDAGSSQNIGTYLPNYMDHIPEDCNLDTALKSWNLT
jgi:hypothetical protein